MTSEEVLDIFKHTGGYITDSHIVYTSGKHGSAYLNKDAVYPHTAYVSKLCKAIAEECRDKDIDVVCGPALGGIILSTWTAYHLSELKGKEILGIYTEKTPDKEQIFTRGYGKLIQGKKVLVVEDILNTGGSVQKVVESVRKAGGEVVGAAALVNRGGVTTNDIGGVPLLTLASVTLSACDESDCLLCQQKVPINTMVGKGKEFLLKNNH